VVVVTGCATSELLSIVIVIVVVNGCANTELKLEYIELLSGVVNVVVVA